MGLGQLLPELPYLKLRSQTALLTHQFDAMRFGRLSDNTGIRQVQGQLAKAIKVQSMFEAQNPGIVSGYKAMGIRSSSSMKWWKDPYKMML